MKKNRLTVPDREISPHFGNTNCRKRNTNDAG